MLGIENIKTYSAEYARSSVIECYSCKITIINNSVRCSIIGLNEVYFSANAFKFNKKINIMFF
jgi:hypothetical protein